MQSIFKTNEGIGQFMLLFALLVILPWNSYAQNTFSGFEQELPEVEFLSKDELIEQMKFIHKEDPFEDKYASFRIFIPKNWEELPESYVRHFKKEDKIIGNVAKFQSDPQDSAKSTITIETFELKHDISAKNWLISHLINYGYVIEGVEAIAKNRAEGLGVIYNKEKVDYRDRLIARINGNRVFLMTFSTPDFLWGQEKNIQASTARTFDILQEDDAEVVKMQSYDLSGYITFTYPATWTPGAIINDGFDRNVASFIRYDKDYMEANSGIHADSQNSSGLINVAIIHRLNFETDAVTEIEKRKKAIEEQGFDIKKKLSHDVKLVFPEHTSSQIFDVYSVSIQEQKHDDFELWLAFMKDKELFYIITMVTAKKGNKPMKWNENKTAFENIIASIKPVVYE